MLAAVWIMLSSMLYTLQLSTGSFPKPLTAQEEQFYLKRSAAGDIEARNILIERNLRLVAHIMKKYYAQSAPAINGHAKLVPLPFTTLLFTGLIRVV